MKRFHVHTHVADLQASIAFYSKLFAAEPTRVESDYAKWMLDDPRINFAISTRGSAAGHRPPGLPDRQRGGTGRAEGARRAADMALLDEGQTTCCYARSEKHWVTDPQGIAWEHFHTLGDIPVFSDGQAGSEGQASACCAPAAPAATASAPAARGKPLAIPVKASGSCC
jgi:hypothetical protein